MNVEGAKKYGNTVFDAGLGLEKDIHTPHIHVIRSPELCARYSFEMLLEVRRLGLMTLPRSGVASRELMSEQQ